MPSKYTESERAGYELTQSGFRNKFLFARRPWFLKVYLFRFGGAAFVGPVGSTEGAAGSVVSVVLSSALALCRDDEAAATETAGKASPSTADARARGTSPSISSQPSSGQAKWISGPGGLTGGVDIAFFAEI